MPPHIMFFSVPVRFRPPVKSLGPELVETNWLSNVSDACWPLYFSMRRLEWVPCQGCPRVSFSPRRWCICHFTIPETHLSFLLPFPLKSIKFPSDLESKMRWKLRKKDSSLAHSPHREILSSTFLPNAWLSRVKLASVFIITM